MKRDSNAERALVEQLQAGVPGAVETLASTYGSKVYQLAFRYMKNREDAEEVTQDVLMKVVKQGRGVPWRRGSLELDLSHHLQHGDVAPAQWQVHASGRSVRARDAGTGPGRRHPAPA